MNLKVIERPVPCNGCTACCEGDATFLHPECGDDVRQYKTKKYKGRLMLAHKKNGECIYLEKGVGCTIHHRRPVVCREMDCRMVLTTLEERGLLLKTLQAGQLNLKWVAAARKKREETRCP